jgi:hypothetical protein
MILFTHITPLSGHTQISDQKTINIEVVVQIYNMLKPNFTVQTAWLLDHIIWYIFSALNYFIFIIKMELSIQCSETIELRWNFEPNPIEIIWFFHSESFLNCLVEPNRSTEHNLSSSSPESIIFSLFWIWKKFCQSQSKSSKSSNVTNLYLIRFGKRFITFDNFSVLKAKLTLSTSK